MCGILGMLNPNGIDEKDLKIFREMLIRNQRRGTDATGIAIAGSIIKSAVPAKRFIDKNWKKIVQKSLGGISMLAHGRRASRGSPRINTNNHPIPSKNWDFCMIHNGVVHSKKLPLKKEETDSLLIVRALDKHWQEGNLLQTVNKSFGEFTGSAVIINILRDSSFLIVRRRGNPLLYYKDENTLFFAQEKAIFPKAFQVKGTFHAVKDNSIGIVHTDGTIDFHQLDKAARLPGELISEGRKDLDYYMRKHQTETRKRREHLINPYLALSHKWALGKKSTRICVCPKCKHEWFGLGNCPKCKNPILKKSQRIDDLFPEIEKDLVQDGFCPLLKDMKWSDRSRFFQWFNERNKKSREPSSSKRINS